MYVLMMCLCCCFCVNRFIISLRHVIVDVDFVFVVNYFTVIINSFRIMNTTIFSI